MQYYERQGECTKCGNCCRHIRIRIMEKEITPRSREYFRKRGIRLRKSQFSGQYYFLIPHACPHLTKGNLCDLHGKGKPEDCRIHPLYPWVHEGLGCGYRWVKKGKD